MAAYRGRANSITYDGQSLLLAPATVAQQAPQVVAAALTKPYFYAVTNVLGTTYTQRATTVTTRTDSYVAKVGGVRNYVDCGGSTDLANTVPAATLITTAETYWGARKTAGFNKVVVCTVPAAGFIMGAQETQRLAYNVLVKASVVPDAVADLAARSELSNSSDLTYYNADTLHPNTAGAAVIAAVIQAALVTIGVS